MDKSYSFTLNAGQFQDLPGGRALCVVSCSAPVDVLVVGHGGEVLAELDQLPEAWRYTPGDSFRTVKVTSQTAGNAIVLGVMREGRLQKG